MADKRHITAEELRKLVSYDKDTGVFVWLPRKPNMYMHSRQTPEGKCARFNNMRAGKRADITADGGYRRIELRKPLKSIRASYAAWLITYGKYPDLEIDHINNDPSDNRLINLREASSSQQKQNRRWGRKDKKLPKGVGIHKSTGKFRAYIGTDHLGLFKTLEEATLAYEKEAVKRYGDFVRLK
jgi:hypothetical protein